MGKRKDPPKDTGGKGHQVLPALRSGGGDPPTGAGGRGHQVLRPLRSGSVNSTWAAGSWRGMEPQRVERITVGTAKRIVGPAHEVLSGLPIPNDLSEPDRDLLIEFRRTVENLNRDLAKVTDQNKLMSGEIEALGKAQKALPVWRATWLTFIAAAAGGAAGNVGVSAASYTAGYTAGFIAGVLHDTFSPDSLCIMT